MINKNHLSFNTIHYLINFKTIQRDNNSNLMYCQTISQKRLEKSGKENIDSINISRVCLKSQSSFQRVTIVSDQSSDDGSDEEIRQSKVNLDLRIRKCRLKDMIRQLLVLRKHNTKNQSYKQVANEHLLFKIIIKWKKIHHSQLKKTIEAEFANEKNHFIILRNAFKAWAFLIEQRLKAEQHYLRKKFESFKLICSCELSLRIRKIQLQNFLVSTELQQLIQYMRIQCKNQKETISKAKKYYEMKTLRKSFDGLINGWLIFRQNSMRYNKYKMAFLFYKQSLYRKVLKALLDHKMEYQQ